MYVEKLKVGGRNLKRIVAGTLEDGDKFICVHC